MTKHIKPIRFRVYADAGRRGLYALVNIWPTKKAMYAHKPLDRTHEASCTGLKVIDFPPKRKGNKQHGRTKPIFAELNFYLGYIGIGCVTHEFTHALFCWAERLRLPLDKASLAKGESYAKKGHNRSLERDSIEERCCYVMGDMVRQFVVKANKLGLYE